MTTRTVFMSGVRIAMKSVMIGAICFVAAGFQAPTPTVSGPSASAASATPARELVTKYCVSCHNQKLKTGNIMLDEADAEHVFNSAETWEKVIVKLRSRSMPPTMLWPGGWSRNWTVGLRRARIRAGPPVFIGSIAPNTPMRCAT